MRFIFTGPESTGKTTFASQAQKRWGGGLVSEMARLYLNEKNGIYTYEDLGKIGRIQMEAENLMANSHRLLWCDTDLITIFIWSMDKFAKVDPLLIRIMDEQVKTDRFYFLCFPDVPWESDPLRENPLDRDRLFNLYENYLLSNELKFCILKGNSDEKFKIIRENINKFGEIANF